MKIIDSRSGDEMVVGGTIRYPQGESVTLLEFKPGLLVAKFLVRSTHRDYSRSSRHLETTTQWVDGPVRYMHPSFMFQRVAFFPS